MSFAVQDYIRRSIDDIWRVQDLYDREKLRSSRNDLEAYVLDRPELRKPIVSAHNLKPNKFALSWRLKNKSWIDITFLGGGYYALSRRKGSFGAKYKEIVSADVDSFVDDPRIRKIILDEFFWNNK